MAYKQLTTEQRYQIYGLWRAGYKKRIEREYKWVGKTIFKKDNTFNSVHENEL